jgi:hypothetical protein
VSSPIGLAAALDHAGVVALDLILGLALPLLFLLEVVERVVHARLPLALIRKLREY